MATYVAAYCYANPGDYSFRSMKYLDIAQYISIALSTKVITLSALSKQKSQKYVITRYYKSDYGLFIELPHGIHKGASHRETSASQQMRITT